MSSVDSRIVTMKFENKDFLKGVTDTISSMDKLKKSLEFSGMGKGLSDLKASTGKLDLNPLHASIDSVSRGFLALSTIAVTALAQISSAAFTAGANLVKSLTIAPVSSGLKEYETNLNSIQTVLANTGLEGQAGLDKVNKALQVLNDYSDKTIYNFSQMARNIGTFTAAGVSLDTSTAAIKGIANLAAISGSSADQASTAMYQLSQALASGRVALMDWNSVVNAGMGGKVFKDSLMETARVHGVAIDQIIKDEGSFRDSLQTGWLTSDILTETLSKFTGDLTAAQLKTMGYNQDQIDGILKLGKTATDAATKVKTMSQLINTLQETVGSGWAKTWQMIFGDFNEARKMFTKINNVLGGMLGAQADARNHVLARWKKLGGRDEVIQGFANAFKALVAVITPIKEAFREIFPAKTGRDLFNMSVAFRKFTEGLIISSDTAEDLKTTFKGIFAILHIFTSIIGGVIRAFADLFGIVLGGGGSVLSLTASIAELVIAFDAWLSKGDKIGTVFDKLIAARRAILEPLIDVIGSILEAFAALISSGPEAFFEALGVTLEKLGILGGVLEDALTDAFDAIGNAISSVMGSLGGSDSLLGGLFGGDELEEAKNDIGAVGEAIKPVIGLTDNLGASWEGVLNAFAAVGDFAGRIWEGLKAGLSVVKDKIAEFFGGMTIGEGLAVVNTGFFIAFYFAVTKFIGSLKNIADSAGDIMKNVSKVLDQVRSNLKTMQTDIRSNIILKIAASILALAIAIYILSKVDAKGLAKGLGAVTILLGELTGALLLLESKASTLGAAKMMLLGIALAILAVALLAMAAAVALFGQMDTGTIVKGLYSIGFVLAGITVMTAALSKTGGAATMLGVATALVIMSVALLMLAGVIKLYDSIDASTLAEGILKIAGVLIVLNIAMAGMSGSLTGASALLIAAGALTVLAGALKIMASMTGGDTVQTLLLLAGALLILGVAIAAMSGSIVGAAALIIAAEGLVLLAAALMVLNEVEWASIAKATVILTALILILGLAGLLLAPIIPVIGVLAVVLLALGIAMLVAGAGMLLFATGLSILAVSGAVGFAVLIAGIVALLEILPLMAQQFGLAIVAFAEVLGEQAPKLQAAFTKLLIGAINGAAETTPHFMRLLGILIDEGIKLIRDKFPDWVDLGWDLILALMKGIEDHLDEVVSSAVRIAITFINAFADEYPKYVDAGFKALIKILHGIADAIRANDEEIGKAGADIALALLEGFLTAFGTFYTEIFNKIKEVVGNAIANIDFSGMISSAIGSAAGGIADAAGGLIPDVLKPGGDNEKSGADTGNKFAAGLMSSRGNVDKAVDTIVASMSRISEAISTGIDVSPVITPLLDLTNMERDATRIGGMFNGGRVSLSQARGVSSDIQASQETMTQLTDSQGETKIEFVQNNTSPKALSAVDIYRQTRNQLSLAKEALR